MKRLKTSLPNAMLKRLATKSSVTTEQDKKTGGAPYENNVI
ncbi:hypothetical protein [Chryseobacterium sp. POL2]|nr:hypothetical protein [Chryseobacterium sp. POL2]